MIDYISADTNNSVDSRYSQQDNSLPHSDPTLDKRLKLEKREGESSYSTNPAKPALEVSLLGPNYKLHCNQDNIPISNQRNTPVGILGHCGQRYRPDRHYIKAKQIETLAADKYKVNGIGIIVTDLLSKGFVSNEKQARATLKHFRKKNILFTLRRRRPQKYYPACLKSEIIKRNIQNSGVNFPNSQSNNHPELILQDNILDSLAIRTPGRQCSAFITQSPIVYPQDSV